MHRLGAIFDCHVANAAPARYPVLTAKKSDHWRRINLDNEEDVANIMLAELGSKACP